MRRTEARSGLAVTWGLLASLLISACAGWPPFRDRGQGTAYTEQELFDDLAAHAALFASIVAATANEIEDLSDSRRVRRSTLIWRLSMIPITQELAFGDDPQESYVETLGLMFAMRNYLTDGDGREIFAAHQPLAVETAREVEEVLDAQNLDARPLAKVHLKHRIPQGFHGNFAGGLV